MSVRFKWTDEALTYLRRSQVGDVLACSLARLLDLLLLLVDHDLARLHGAALGEVELRPRRLAGGEDVWRQGIVVEAVERSATTNHCKKLTKADLQVWNINCRSDRARQMVGEQTIIAKLPSEQITDEQDCNG